MKRLVAMMMCAVSLGAAAQSTITYPYNPDGNADSLIGVIDLQDLLGVYGNPFTPSEIMVGDTGLAEWVMILSQELEDQQAAVDAIQEADGAIGLPSDGGYGDDGNQAGAITGIDQGISIEDALDKIETILAKLAPAGPPSLSSSTISISNTWDALEINTGIPRTKIIDNQQPVGNILSPFGNAGSGTLSAAINFIEEGAIVMSSADQSGQNDLALTIIEETVLNDFWQQMTAEVQSQSLLEVGNTVHNYSMTHSLTGTSAIDFYVDETNNAPVVSEVSSITGVNTSEKMISGIPTLSTSDILEFNFNVAGAVTYFYNDETIAKVTSPVLNDTNVPFCNIFVNGNPICITPPNKGDVVNVVDFAVSPKEGVYSEHPVFTYLGYSSNDSSQSYVSNSTIRIDTKSDESIRVKSGVGLYPSFCQYCLESDEDAGSWYDSNQSLSDNEELLLLNAEFQYPFGNYTTNQPIAGPDYSNLPGYTGPISVTLPVVDNMRWATFYLGELTNASSFYLDILGASGDWQAWDDCALFVKVESDTDEPCINSASNCTTGWLDAGTDITTPGNPSAPRFDGDYVLDSGSSLATNRRISFGTGARTGSLFVRIGISQDSGLKFENIVMSEL